MKTLLKRCLWCAALVAFAVAPALHAQESPVLRVDIIQVAVTGGLIFATPNESYGPAGSRVDITAQAEGTFTTTALPTVSLSMARLLAATQPPLLPR